MDRDEKQFKEAAQELLDADEDLMPMGSDEELDWLAKCEKLILQHRLFEIIRGKAI